MLLTKLIPINLFYQGKETRSLQGERFAKHIEEDYIPSNKSWVVLFPEGGFLYKRKESSQK